MRNNVYSDIKASEYFFCAKLYFSYMALPNSWNRQLNSCLFHEMGKSVAYFMKWTIFWPILRNGQFHRLCVAYIYHYIYFLISLIPGGVGVLRGMYAYVSVCPCELPNNYTLDMGNIFYTWGEWGAGGGLTETGPISKMVWIQIYIVYSDMNNSKPINWIGLLFSHKMGSTCGWYGARSKEAGSKTQNSELKIEVGEGFCVLQH